jgi:hypothetical protein
MAWKKGQSGNPGGRPTEKMIAEQMRLMVNEEDQARGKKRLRCLLEKVYEEAMSGEGWAACQIFDRIDGKPAQESTVTLDDKRDATDWTRDELVALINDARKSSNGAAPADGRSSESDSVH